MGQAKVSVVMPIYNTENYLRESLESVLNQTLKEIEVVCVNDGSTDSSRDILEEYAEKDDRITILDKENSGYGASMNLGIGQASGEYIGIVEPDDFILPDMYEKLYDTATKNDLDFVKADFYRFTSNENGDMQLKYIHLYKNPEDYNVVFCPREKVQAFRYTMNTWSGIYRREFINSHHIRHNETPGASFQDNGFYFMVNVYAKRAMLVNTPFYMNRRDNPSSSMNDSQKIYDLNIEYDCIRRTLEQSQEIWEQFCGFYWLKKFHNYEGTIKRIDDKFLSEYIYRFSAEFQRGYETGELKQEYFNDSEWERLRQIMSDPDGYCQTYFKKRYSSKLTKSEKELTGKVKRLRKQLKEVKNSHSYKLGHAILWIPGKIINVFRKLSGTLK